jgi:hypothetical protein
LQSHSAGVPVAAAYPLRVEPRPSIIIAVAIVLLCKKALDRNLAEWRRQQPVLGCPIVGHAPETSWHNRPFGTTMRIGSCHPASLGGTDETIAPPPVWLASALSRQGAPGIFDPSLRMFLWLINDVPNVSDRFRTVPNFCVSAIGAILAQVFWFFTKVVAMNSEGGDGAAAIRLLGQRFPRHEMQLRRRYRQDEEFRLLCDDHLLAVQAFEHWRAAGDAGKTEEYRQLVEEAGSLILAKLERGPR